MTRPASRPNCTNCLEIPRRERIAAPDRLGAVIERTRQYIAEGRLIELPHPGLGELPWNQEPFADLPVTGPWDDILLYRFTCTLCGAVFRLHADTYHGSASWELEDRDA